MGYKSLAQILARRNRPVSSNVRPQSFTATDRRSPTTEEVNMNMHSFFRLGQTAILIGACVACTSIQTETSPVLGTWNISFAGGKCLEVHTYRADGTSTKQSAEEVLEETWEIDNVEPGVYVVGAQVTKTNGKKDCTGKPTAVGARSNAILRFNNNGDYYICPNHNTLSCNGSATKVKAAR